MTVEISGRSLFVEANGLRHHVLAYGERGLADILILPGITSPAATADFIAAPLAAMGYAVFVPDIRGRGDSDTPPSGNYTLADYAADVAGLIEALGLNAPVILGHSMGARIAAAYAVEHAPDTHGPLILVDPPTSGPGRGDYPTTLASFMAQLEQARRGTTSDDVRAFYPKWPERELQLRVERLASCDETAVRETHAGFNADDFFAIWSRLTRPATLIRGADSPVVPDDAAADLARANQSIPIVAVPNSGHMVPWDNYGDFFKLLTRLLPRQSVRSLQSETSGE
jgi:N-formylmaleamate deformylase